MRPDAALNLYPIAAMVVLSLVIVTQYQRLQDNTLVISDLHYYGRV